MKGLNIILFIALHIINHSAAGGGSQGLVLVGSAAGGHGAVSALPPLD